MLINLPKVKPRVSVGEDIRAPVSYFSVNSYHHKLIFLSFVLQGDSVILHYMII